MAHIVSEGAIDSRKPQDLDYKRILTEIRLTYQELKDQASRLEHLAEEITTIKDQLSTKMPFEKASIIKSTLRENVEDQKRNILTLCFSLTSSLKKNDNIKNSYAHQLALLDSYLQKLKASDAGQNCGIDSLSLSELRIASMIKIGMTTEQIAECLHISSDTVKTHRRNIRRKLDIVGKKNDLASHLRDEAPLHAMEPAD